MQNKGKNKWIFLKYYATYAFMFLLPILLTGIIIIFYLSRLFLNEVVLNNLNNLNEVKNNFEEQVDKMDRFKYQVIINSEIRPFSLDNYPLKGRYILNELKKFISINDFFDEVFLQFYNDNYVYSSRSTYEINLNDQYRQIFEEIIFTPPQNNNLIPSIKRVELDDQSVNVDGNYITFMYPLNQNNYNDYCNVSYLISENKLKSIISNVSNDFGSNTLIIDGNGEIVISLEDTDYLREDAFFNTINEIQGSFLKKVKISSKDYSIFIVRSSEKNFKYITVIPSKMLFGKIENIRVILIVLFLILIVTGLISVLYNMRLTNIPIRQLTKVRDMFLKENSNQNLNDIQSIKHTINCLLSAKSELDENIEKSKEAVKEFLLLQLIKGEIETREEFNLRGKLFGTTIDKPFVTVAIIQFTTKLSSDVTLKLIIQHVENYLPDHINIYGCCSDNKNQVVFFISTDHESNAVLKKDLELIHESLFNLIKQTTILGVGELFRELHQMGKAYIEASTALEYKFAAGSNNVILFDDIKVDRSNYTIFEIIDSDILNKAIRKGDVKHIKSIVKEFIECTHKMEISLFTAICISYDILNTIIKTSYEIYGQRFQSIQKFSEAEHMTNFESVEELCVIIERFSDKLCETIEKQKNCESVEQILSFINNNYTDCFFSIKNTANHFGMSMSYFSRYFKEQTGKNMSEYIAEIRMNYAKEMLEKTDNDLKSIVEKIGYTDISSFIRKFKASEGITPNQYRILKKI